MFRLQRERQSNGRGLRFPLTGIKYQYRSETNSQPREGNWRRPNLIRVMSTRTQILVRGTVQGVGFRPYIFSLARRGELRGNVLNNEIGVLIDVEGDEQNIRHFVDQIRLTPPPLSTIESVELFDVPTPANFSDFRIVESESNGAKLVNVSVDTATCLDCLSELFDPGDRRYRYPFINCTNCGPRFTIVEGVPYDRARTTMREFEMCYLCRAEYEEPLNRRFHAEPIACAACGPRVFLKGGNGIKLDGDVIDRVRGLIAAGKIVAIKGLGGFHLACDAEDPVAVATLRARKYREDKPFALMARSIEVIERFCHVSRPERELLESTQRPIVLLERKSDSELPDVIAPGVKTFGFMLPYTPIHYLLLEGLDRPLVMTSGNISDEPICYQDDEATRRLSRIADYYLLHNRRIHMRTDDSVVRQVNRPQSKRATEYVLRRSRGYAPSPIRTAFKFHRQILACGAELKNTFCLTRDHHAFISHHIGDLENLETSRSFTEGIEHFKQLFDLRPEIVAYDLHPEYLSNKYALSLDHIEERIGVQHHHAHIASCLADNDAEGEVIGVAMDGLGFGTDGRMWGGEFFVADYQHAERVAHLDYVPMPGGAKAVHEPWRMAAVYLQRAFGDEFLNLPLPFVAQLDRADWATLRSMTVSQTNCPETSSMGRLFDAVSALLCLRQTVNYEGQAAIELETAADEAIADGYEFSIDNEGVIEADGLIRTAVNDLLDGRRPSEISAKFHLAVVQLIEQVARRLRDDRHLNRVALSGGVFQNMFLLERAIQSLESDGFEVLRHRRVPTNDGGISLGQAAVANASIASGRI